MFKIGDKVFIASHGNEQEIVKCPVCFGKREVKLTLGDDSEVVLPCDFCARGFAPPTGTVSEYVVKGRVTPCTIESIDKKESVNGVECTYHSGHHYFTDENTFPSEGQAQAEADRLSEKQKIVENTRAEFIKKDVHKKYSWNAGYHMREAKKKRAEADRHDIKAKLCKEKAK